MTKREKGSGRLDDLRRKAEDMALDAAPGMREGAEMLSSEETRKVLHELRVHQIELEMQNEELRRTQVELEASRARYFDLYDLAPVGYCTLSEKGLLLEVNLTAACLLGVSRSDLLGQPLTRFIFPEDQDVLYRLQRILLATGHPQGCELRMLREASTPFWARIEATTIRDEANGAPVWRAMVIDISQLKRAEDVLRHNERELAEKNAVLERFTAAVSHDLKTPLVTIRIYLGFLKQEILQRNEEGIEKQLGIIAKVSDKMYQLLEELSDLLRVGHTKNALVEIPLQAVVEEALNLVAGRIAERGVDVVVSKDPVTLTGDRQRLVEVFQNLLDNAVKFMGDQKTPRVEIGLERTGAGPEFFVRDNGMGIDPQYLPKIFGLFEKLDPKAQGTGLGLALVKRIVEVHGGSIRAESGGPGLGTTIRFTLANTRQRVPGESGA